MTKLCRMAVVAVLAALASTAQAQQDGSYNTKYGMIFSLDNVFTRSTILSGYSGGVGLQYTLAPTRAIRLTVDVSRESNPPWESETTNITTGVTTKTYNVPAGNTSDLFVGLGASYIMRLSNAALSPYLGMGAGVSLDQGSRNWEDSISSTTVTTAQDRTQRTLALNGAGQLGVEWRVHKSISLFAEYALSVDLLSRTSSSDEQTSTVKATGAVSGSRSEYTTTRWLNFDTGLVQGGSLGVIAFF